MSISKQTFLARLGTFKMQADATYCKQADLGYNTVVSNTEPTTGAHWIQPDDTSGTMRASKVIAASSAPGDSEAIWIDTAQ